MEAYTGFAEVYDRFMDNVPYTEWCEAVVSYLKEYGIEDGLVLDLCCGTGTLTELLSEHGYDMIGVDFSEDMLAIAREKQLGTADNQSDDNQPVDNQLTDSSSADSNEDAQILYLCQDAREFELYGTVRAIVSACDSINYMLEVEDLKKIFALVHNYLDFDGIFIFDMNTRFKYESLLADNTFAENREECSFIWENTYDRDSCINEYDLTIFVQDEDDEEVYYRMNEIHYQRAYDIDLIKKLVADEGLILEAIYDSYTHDEVRADSERVTVIVKKEGQ